MTVIPLNARAAEPAPREAETYVRVEPAARHAMHALDGRVAELRRCFSGNFMTSAAKARVEKLIAEVRTEAATLARFAR